MRVKAVPGLLLQFSMLFVLNSPLISASDKSPLCADSAIPRSYIVDGQTLDLIQSISLNPNGDRIAIAQVSGVYIYDADTLQPISWLYCHTLQPDLIYPVSWSPDGLKIATFDQNNGIIVWDATTQARTVSLKHEDDPNTIANNGERNPSIRVYTLAWSPDSRYLAAVGDIPLRVWDVQTKTIIFTSELTTPNDYKSPGRLIWSSDGSQLFFADFERILIWDTDDWRIAGEIPQPPSSIDSLSLSDTNKLAWGGLFNNLHIWDLETNASVLDDSENTTVAHTVSWLKGTERIAIATDPENYSGRDRNSLIKILDVSLGTTNQSLAEHTNTVISLQWYPDGERLLSLESQFPTSRLFEWDVNTGEILARLEINAEDA